MNDILVVLFQDCRLLTRTRDDIILSAVVAVIELDK